MSHGSGMVIDVECVKETWVAVDGAMINDRLKCQPVCNMPCLHNGNCVAPNVCQCLPEYSGPQCQNLRPKGGCSLDPPAVPNSILEYE